MKFHTYRKKKIASKVLKGFEGVSHLNETVHTARDEILTVRTKYR